MFKLQPNERLGRWKQFRFKIDSMSLDCAISSTVDFWNKCPFTPFYLDPDNPEFWPDPWQLITENYYCELAKVLGIIYTLYLSNHKSSLNPEIRVYYDSETHHTYHIAWFNDGKYIVNLHDTEIVNKQHIQNQKLIEKRRYTSKDLQLEKY